MEPCARRRLLGALAAGGALGALAMLLQTLWHGTPDALTVSITATFAAATVAWSMISSPREVLGGPVCRECGDPTRGLDFGFCLHCGSTRFLGAQDRSS